MARTSLNHQGGGVPEMAMAERVGLGAGCPPCTAGKRSAGSHPLVSHISAGQRPIMVFGAELRVVATCKKRELVVRLEASAGQPGPAGSRLGIRPTGGF